MRQAAYWRKLLLDKLRDRGILAACRTAASDNRVAKRTSSCAASETVGCTDLDFARQAVGIHRGDLNDNQR